MEDHSCHENEMYGNFGMINQLHLLVTRGQNRDFHGLADCDFNFSFSLLSISLCEMNKIYYENSKFSIVNNKLVLCISDFLCYYLYIIIYIIISIYLSTKF